MRLHDLDKVAFWLVIGDNEHLEKRMLTITVYLPEPYISSIYASFIHAVQRMSGESHQELVLTVVVIYVRCMESSC